jgi:hypothetical protein
MIKKSATVVLTKGYTTNLTKSSVVKYSAASFTDLINCTKYIDAFYGKTVAATSEDDPNNVDCNKVLQNYADTGRSVTVDNSNNDIEQQTKTANPINDHTDRQIDYNGQIPYQSLTADKTTGTFKETSTFIYEFAKVIDQAGSEELNTITGTEDWNDLIIDCNFQGFSCLDSK